MSLAILYVDDRGQPAIDAYAVMQNAIDLYFATNDPSKIDVDNVTSGIADFHSRLLNVATSLLSREPSAESLRPKPSITSVADNVITADFTPPARQPPADAAPVIGPAEVKEVLRTTEQPETVSQPSLAAPPTAARAKVPAFKPQIVAPTPVPSAPVVEVATPKRRRADVAPAAPKLPRRLSKIEDALKMDKIICLEDGKAVVDLGKHLASLGIAPADYLAKWGLPPTYPMKAPSVIMKHGISYEYDPARNRMIRT